MMISIGQVSTGHVIVVIGDQMERMIISNVSACHG